MKRLRSERGLALLLVISLLALVTLLVVSLAVITRVETQLSSTVISRAQARSNALFAADMALGQLQRYAGPDTVATALSLSLNANDVNNPHWVGTWPSDDTGISPQTWLVSGNETESLNSRPVTDLARSNNPNTETVATVYADELNSGIASVSVPKVALTQSSLNGETFNSGRFAWWVGDESMKTRVAIPSPGEALETLLRNDEIEAVTQAVALRPDLTAVVADDGMDQSQLSRVQTRSSLELIDTQLRPSLIFHELSVDSEGILSSTLANAASGLKSDLSISPVAENQDLARWFDLQSAMVEPGDLEHTRRYAIASGTDEVAGDIIDHISPVLTDFAVGVYVFSPNSRNQNLTVRLQLHVELWNPYSSELLVEPLRIRIRGLPVIRVVCSNGDEQEVDLDALAGGSPEVDLVPLDSDLFRFLPGRVLNWTGFGHQVSGRWQSTPNSKAGDVGQADFPTAVVLPTAMNSSARLELESDSETRLEVDLIDPDTNRVMSVSESPLFEPLARASYAHTSVSGRVSYRFRLADRVDYGLGDPHGWFFEWDVRNPRMDESRFVVDQPQPGNFTSFRYISIGDPSFSMFDRSASSQSGATSLGIKHDVVLFELPRHPINSLSPLQHLGVVGAAPFAIGNSWVTETPLSSSLYDNYFASGLDEQLWSAGVARNARLKVYTPSGGQRPTWEELNADVSARSPRNLVQVGPMNLNTTNETAWAAVMGSGDFPAWRHVNLSNDFGAQNSLSGSDTIPRGLENAFFRFSQSAAETYVIDNEVRGFDVEETQFYRRGVTELSDPEVDRLAEIMARRVGERLSASGPFRSMGEFVSSGILADALDELEGNTSIRTSVRLELPDTTDESIDQQSPSYLSQADLLGSLLPTATVRGDTFVVRGMGEALNQATGEPSANRYFEITAQRIPEFIDAANAAEDDRQTLSPLNLRFGRRFVITQFRWLTSSSD